MTPVSAVIIILALLPGCHQAVSEPTSEAITPTPTSALPQPCPGSSSAITQPTPDNNQDAGLVRLQHVMTKAQRGEKIVIAGLGGSITQGDKARDEKRYIAQVYDWWNNKYPGQITLINAGVGATGLGLGTLRIENDLLKENPDLVMVDFAVNDLGVPARQETLEGVVRKILNRPNNPAVILAYFVVKSGNTTQADFEPIAEHYHIAQVSYGDRLKQLVAAGAISLDDVFADDTHPNDLGHTYAAQFINEYLDSVYEDLPADDADIPAVAGIPAPLYSDTFQYTQVYNRRNFTPAITGSWKNGYFVRRTGEGWVGDQVGDEMTFEELPGMASMALLPSISWWCRIFL
jgi:hypothetical protein